MLICCVRCKSTENDLTNVRGESLYEEFVKRDLSEDEKQKIRANRPLYCCLECVRVIDISRRSVQNSLLSPEPLRNTNPDDQRSPGSSFAANDVLSSESFDPSVHSSESIVPDGNSQPACSQPIASSRLMDDAFVPPKNTVLLAKYNQIMAKPFPLSVKRKLVQEITSGQENASEELDGTIVIDIPKICERLQKKARAPAPKRARPINTTGSSNASSVSNSGPKSVPQSGEQIDQHPSAIPWSPISLAITSQSPRLDDQPLGNRPQIAIRTQSRIIAQRSPPTESRVVIQRASSSESSALPMPPPPTQSRIVIQRSSSSESSTSPMPPPRTKSKKRDDGNGHSNTAAPRRIQVPSLAAPNSGASSRGPRSNVKNLGG